MKLNLLLFLAIKCVPEMQELNGFTWNESAETVTLYWANYKLLFTTGMQVFEIINDCYFDTELSQEFQKSLRLNFTQHEYLLS